MRIFHVAIALAVLGGMLSTANAQCIGRGGEPLPPVAVADSQGTFVVPTKSGGTLRVTGFPPHAPLYRNLLFAIESMRCRGEAYLEGQRDTKYCGGRKKMCGKFCGHIACKPRQ